MKCVSSCFSCLCGSRNSSRVAPSEPIQIIHPNQDKYRPQKGSQNGGEQPLRGGDANGSINPNFSMGDDDDDDHDPTNTDPRGGESVTDSSASTSILRVKALYIEVGKDRLLRVIHIPSSEQSESSSPAKSPSSLKKEGSPTSEKNEDGEENENDNENPSSPEEPESKTEKEAEPGGDDDEEEYWFSKWARKPRFRSIFAKNPDQRPKLNNENNNNSDEGNKISVEAEMARAAAAARRRAWAYNNNGNCEPTITQQPSINPNDEEEFSSIAIVNSTKQQWSKGNSNSSSSNSIDKEGSPTVEVQVSVERHSDRTRSDMAMEGVSNPAFQDDDEEDPLDQDVVCNGEEETVPEYKTEENEQNTSKVSSTSTNSTASLKTSIASSSNSQDEDAIMSDSTEIVNGDSPQEGGASSNASLQKDPPKNVIISTPKKPIIFFIHSISGSSDVWRNQMEYFQQLGYEIVAPDLLGHGLSSTPLNPKYYYFESLVQDLILIFDHFTKEDVKVVLVGHGYGACLAAMLTRIRLKNIALLITIAGGGPTPLVRRTCCQDSWFSWKCKLFHSNRIRGRFDNPELKLILPPAIYKNVLSGQVWGDGDSAFYRRVTVPTLLVYGMRDKVVTLVEECEMERTIPKSFLELIDSAGHMVMLDEPEKLNKMLCKFIQSWS